MISDQDLLAQFASQTGAPVEVRKIKQPEEAAAVYAQTHCGFISGSNVAKLCSYQPEICDIEQLETEIEELTHKILSSTTGKTKTASDARETKQRQLDRLTSGELPSGAVKFCEELAMLRITGYCEKSDVDFRSKECVWGVDNEPLAVDALSKYYSDIRATKENQSFIKLRDFDRVGCTPDGVIYTDDEPLMSMDIKCPFNRRIHGIDNRNVQSFAQFKRDNSAYYWQFTLQMLCVGVEKHLFASFDPRFPAELQLIMHEFERVEQDAAFMLSRIAQAEKMINGIIAELGTA
jgi:hypothetical protein